jgi:hypothetical protein
VALWFYKVPALLASAGALVGIGVGSQPRRDLGPYSAAANFSLDLQGDPDSRPGTWGSAGFHVFQIRFSPPLGHRVRILRAYGDFLVWPKGQVASGKFAGALFALHNSGPEGSVRADWAADNTFLYIQVATSGEPARAAFDYDTEAGGLLAADHVLNVKVAVWLNDTGLEIHCEPTFTLVYRFERP